MSIDRVRGLAASLADFDALDAATKVGMGILLNDIGDDILAAERADVAVATGALKADLTVQSQIEQLRVRVGIIGALRGRSKRFYARFVEFGRRAQVVLVQRRKRVKGRLRVSKGRKIAADIAATYSMTVKAQAARPFVFKERPQLDAQIAQRIADFWSITDGAVA